ncbi:transporter substrate-binding domain-containing protein [Variovorax boronicumulans]|uniref:transporter substrate-binding domain-containing protein n=1 Tax=Variovorax boronicumulans TaxID=436515 RepID=UPI0035A89191
MRRPKARRGWLVLCGSIAFFVFGSAGVVHSQDIDTLKRIADTGTVRLGHRESSIPFSYYDEKRNAVGFSHDLMLKIVDTLKSNLGLPGLTIKLVPVTPQNRLALVQNGSVDIECASTTHNQERARQVAFSTSFFQIGTRLLTHRSSGIHDFSDLAGKRVAVTSATTSERLLRTYNERSVKGFRILVGKDHGESFELVTSGKADAFMMDDALLYGERAKVANPQDWDVVGTPMSSEVYGCMMRLKDQQLKQIVDGALIKMMTSGEILKVHQKWFQRPIPPRGLNLAWPPSPELRQLYAHPNDQPSE